MCLKSNIIELKTVRDRKIVLTHGFTKKTQKTPPGEIERAKKYKADYERRGINHG